MRSWGMVRIRHPMATKTSINGQRLRSARKAANLRQHELGALVGIGQGHISAIELGLTGVSVEVLTEMSSALGVSVTWLCGGESTDRVGPGSLTATAILDDPTSPQGLVAFAGNFALVKALKIVDLEWAALRTLVPPKPLTQQGYLLVLLALRSGGIDSDGQE
jgi:transcriptional regulator with XRE-family HTH domain